MINPPNNVCNVKDPPAPFFRLQISIDVRMLCPVSSSESSTSSKLPVHTIMQLNLRHIFQLDLSLRSISNSLSQDKNAVPFNTSNIQAYSFTLKQSSNGNRDNMGNHYLQNSSSFNLVITFQDNFN